MKNNAIFHINLQGLDLSEDQTRELEQKLTDTTMEYLGSFKAGKDFISNAVAYTPHPDDPYPWPFPWPGPWGPILGPIGPYPFPRPFPGFFPINRKILDRTLVSLKK
ncbi:hypothetical protein [Portibacter marinus]|uniref:hypothetical protein n=1 Tax=Portibacter marinus TaxID=2898660 RepID=UPI001F168AEB|nr:hypothetical protein [Portibacter marinus]